MNKNQTWKKVLIVALVLIAALSITPLDKKLKPGLDLGGGTSLIYSIDTEGMTADEIKGVSTKMVPILMRRIDPQGMSNIIIKPQGDTRIEIQLPLASKQTREKRQAYQNILDSIESENINLATITRALSKDNATREKIFAKMAGGSQEKKTILENLAKAYDDREAARKLRDKALEEENSISKKLASMHIDVNSLTSKLSDWSKLAPKELEEAVEGFVNPSTDDNKNLSAEQLSSKDMIIKYVKAYKSWAGIVNKLTANNGINAKYDKALSQITKLNISIDALVANVETRSGRKYIDQLKAQFPEKAAKIDAFVKAFDEYKPLRGTLDDPEDVKRMLKGAGILEFRILPSVGDGKLTAQMAQNYIEDLKLRGPKLASDGNYVWVAIENPNDFKGNNAVIAKFADNLYVLASNSPTETMLHNPSLNWKLTKAWPTADQNGRRAIGFAFNDIASNMFFKLTSNNIDKPLCIILDDKALSAPNINSAISSSGIITGSYNQVQQNDMVNKLNAGSLPARISDAPISEKTIGATIGEKYRDQGIESGIWGLAIVAVFMMVYYRFGGVIATIALVLNILFILAVMSISAATFTLPGIAGLILTIGMAVDANVLIFERIREELASGSSLRIAINNGYSKAFRTILDANLTTFITALILMLVASEEIKGFAIVLMIGIISSMFTALFVTRVLFDSLMAMGWIKDTLRMRSFVNQPNFDWMGKRTVFFTISAVLIIAGLSVFFTRDNSRSNKYDIEFTGGTSVQINLKKGQKFNQAQIEAMIQAVGKKEGNSGLMSAKVYSVGDTGRQFEINTIETNKSVVDVTFNTAKTADAIKKMVADATKKLDSSAKNISVVAGKDRNTFTISMSQLSKSEIKSILEEAFKGSDAKIGEPKVDQIVNNAVTEAFGSILEREENLNPKITSVSFIDDATVNETPELSAYISGLKIECKLSEKVSSAQLKERFKNLRFKRDLDDLSWYKYELLDSDYLPLDDNTKVDSFVYVSLQPDAGYRELEANEKDRYIDNETKKVLAATSYEASLPRVSQFNPSIGDESKRKAIVAIIFSLLAIIAYVWIRFGDARFGFAAIAALVHDVCITLGAVTACTYIAGTPIGEYLGIRDFKINLQMIAAFLTIIGYSLNDTIVVFDRIRENRGKTTNITPTIITKSINQTLSRTILTSLTTFMVVLVMYIGGGIGLRGFTFAMLIGIVVGTYSSIAIAAPILLIGKKNSK